MGITNGDVKGEVMPAQSSWGEGGESTETDRFWPLDTDTGPSRQWVQLNNSSICVLGFLLGVCVSGSALTHLFDGLSLYGLSLYTHL